MRVSIISLFPDICQTYLQTSILGRATEQGLLDVHYFNPIDEAESAKRVDDRPYGGGPGMVLRAEPFLRCLEKAVQGSGRETVLFFTPRGDLFNQERAQTYAAYDHLVLLCGHYEGIDERVALIAEAERISVGSFTLTGGEIPALLVIDAVSRHIPGVLGNESSREETRVAGGSVYTRPQVIVHEGKEYAVPDVLISGNHKDIDTYREETV
ncbi:MAG: tRNA (guanosine(37)-N1)-methyltransferase TrmD [Candidatus Kaiserbacteria bacterium]|nr:tRNA (guanosine(37)-N1)-methyltransferase TrmD [Candidatus Kaiserbacteria bacterium]